MFRLQASHCLNLVSAIPLAATVAVLALWMPANLKAESSYNPYVPASERGISAERLPQSDRDSRWKKMWKWSAAALVAGSAMDVSSSFGYQEANGMLRSSGGQLQGRGTAIKFGVLGGALIGQQYLLRKNPEMAKPLAFTNFAIGAAYSGVAVRNWRVR